MSERCTATPPCMVKGQIQWHRRRSDCPKYIAPAQPPAPAPEAPQTAPAPQVTPQPTKKTLKQKLGWTGAKVSETPTVPGVEPAKPVETKWLVDGPHTREALNILYGGMRDVTNFSASYLEVPPPPPELFQLKPFQDASIDSDPQNYYTRGVTSVCKALGAKTQEQAHHQISMAGFAYGFGTVFGAVGLWYFQAIKTSPKLKKRKAEKERKAAEKKALDAQAKAQPPETPPETAT